ncbi:unnamed protein product [Durusdinium trenchii]|uniref:LRAT domain-containing protein n=3 Tax=Durusdinium trenchii TaxID=1381693 RepID=A0ABP0S0X5_9DINO
MDSLCLAELAEPACDRSRLVFNYGQLKPCALDYINETVDGLVRHNPQLAEELTWRCYLGQSSLRGLAHWMLLLQPVQEKEVAVPFSQMRNATIEMADSMTRSVDPGHFFLAIELLVDEDTFFPRLSVKILDIDGGDGGQLIPLNDLNASTIHAVAFAAVERAKKIKSYGLFGSNCQHYIQDLVKHLKLDSELPTDDHKIMDFLRAITVTGCLGGAIARGALAVAAGASCSVAVGSLAAGSLVALGLSKGISSAYHAVYSRQHDDAM